MTEKTIDTDVLVIGSGAAGIAAALRAAHDGHRVLVIEKDERLGGTTAISGGWLWVPGNEQGVREGDTREEAETYIKYLAKGNHNPEMVDTFLDACGHSGMRPARSARPGCRRCCTSGPTAAPTATR
jgi:succinate dehydrogenase/fumarate reductase flavoprotein subunit